MDAQPISNPERLMMASEMDLDEADEEAMAIVAHELGLKIGNKVCQLSLCKEYVANCKMNSNFQVDSLADEVRDAGRLLAGMVGRAVDAVDDTLRKVIPSHSSKLSISIIISFCSATSRTMSCVYVCMHHEVSKLGQGCPDPFFLPFSPLSFSANQPRGAQNSPGCCFWILAKRLGTVVMTKSKRKSVLNQKLNQQFV